MKATRLPLHLKGVSQAVRPQPERCLHNTNPSFHHPAHLHHSPRRHFTGTPTTTRRLDHHEEDVRRATLAIEPAQLEEDLAALNLRAAPEIDFDSQDREALQASRRRAADFLRKLRVVPESPSYFTARPTFTDDLLALQALLRRHTTLPTLRPADAPRVAWRELDTYRAATDEPVRNSRYKRLVEILKRVNLIRPQLMPAEVTAAIEHWKRDIQPFNNRPAPIEVDEFGRAAAVGRRKASSAKAWVVEGEGEVLVNGKPLHRAFARVHDRESVVWALKATQRVDKYNVFATVHGGGTTGQAEALTLAVSKALMAHEPLLKPALRRAGCVARDPRRVERKKPGKLKARKMPAWVKR